MGTYSIIPLIGVFCWNFHHPCKQQAAIEGFDAVRKRPVKDHFPWNIHRKRALIHNDETLIY